MRIRVAGIAAVSAVLAVAACSSEEKPESAGATSAVTSPGATSPSAAPSSGGTAASASVDELKAALLTEEEVGDGYTAFDAGETTAGESGASSAPAGGGTGDILGGGSFEPADCATAVTGLAGLVPDLESAPTAIFFPGDNPDAPALSQQLVPGAADALGTLSEVAGTCAEFSGTTPQGGTLDGSLTKFDGPDLGDDSFGFRATVHFGSSPMGKPGSSGLAVVLVSYGDILVVVNATDIFSAEGEQLSTEAPYVEQKLVDLAEKGVAKLQDALD